MSLPNSKDCSARGLFAFQPRGQAVGDLVAFVDEEFRGEKKSCSVDPKPPMVPRGRRNSSPAIEKSIVSSSSQPREETMFFDSKHTFEKRVKDAATTQCELLIAQTKAAQLALKEAQQANSALQVQRAPFFY